MKNLPLKLSSVSKLICTAPEKPYKYYNKQIAIDVHKNKKRSAKIIVGQAGGDRLPYMPYVWSVAVRMLSTLLTNHGMPTWSRVSTLW